MVHGCGNRMLKFLFFTANLLLCAFGALIFGFSLWANLDKDFADNLKKLAEEMHEEDMNILTKYQTSLWILVAIGAILFLVGFLGCCGAMCESTVLLTLFFVIVLILTTIEVGTVILAATSKNQFKSALYRLLSEAGNAEDKYLVNLKPVEDIFQCCGATHETRNRYVTQQLCLGELQNKAGEFLPLFKILDMKRWLKVPDCFTVISDWLESTGEAIIVIDVFLLIIELFALISTCILCKAFRYERPYYYA